MWKFEQNLWERLQNRCRCLDFAKLSPKMKVQTLYFGRSCFYLLLFGQDRRNLGKFGGNLGANGACSVHWFKNAPNMRRNAVVLWRPFSGKFREIWAKSFAPPKICLLLHLCLVPSVMRKSHDWRHHVEGLVKLLKENLSSLLSIPL